MEINGIELSFDLDYSLLQSHSIAVHTIKLHWPDAHIVEEEEDGQKCIFFYKDKLSYDVWEADVPYGEETQLVYLNFKEENQAIIGYAPTCGSSIMARILLNLLEKVVSLTPLQIDFATRQMANWMRILEENKMYPPTIADVDHSALLHRLLSGKKAHEHAPPKRFSYPAWEMVEDDEIQVFQFNDYSDLKDNIGIVIDQHRGYEWVDKENKILKYIRLNILYQFSEREVEYFEYHKDQPPKLCKRIAQFLTRIKPTE